MKKIILVISILLFTGCTAEYHINFIDDKIEENLSFIDAGSNEYNAIKNNDFAPIPSYIDSVENLEEPKKNEGVEYYEVKAKNNNIYLNYKHDISDFNRSYIINNCYSYFRVFEEENEIVFSTDKRFLCDISEYGASTVDIIIETNHEVLFNNAHEIDGDKYIWHITPENKDEANIQISFSKETHKSNFDKVLENYSAKVIIFGGSIIILGIILGIIIRLRYKRVNKI